MSSIDNQNMLSPLQNNRPVMNTVPKDAPTSYVSTNAYSYNWFILSEGNAITGPTTQSPAQLNDLDSRVELLDSLCHRLGPDMYPAFLQLLFVVEHHSDAQIQKQLTDTLVYAMSTGRLPSGVLPAWGSTSQTTSNPYSTSRALGPIEFLCAWYAQPTNLPRIQDETFDDALSTLLRLIDSNRTARKMYCYNLNMDAINDSVGMFSRATRTAITRLAKTWNANGCSDTLAAQFIVFRYRHNTASSSIRCAEEQGPSSNRKCSLARPNSLVSSSPVSLNIWLNVLIEPTSKKSRFTPVRT